jgi:recombination protein RecA
MPEKKDYIEELIDRFGEEMIVKGTEKLEVIPTGSLSLDASIGIGGIPRGRITEIFGAEGGGKTTLALSIARSAVKLGIKTFYCDAETMINHDTVFELLGEELDQNLFTIGHLESAEQNLSACEIAINSGQVGCIILDSIGALAPEIEKKKDLTDPTVGLIPKLMTVWLRRNANAIGKNNVAFIFINQVRDQIGSYVHSFSTPGGHALKHFASVRISLSKGEEIKQGTESVGINVKFTVKKNKLAPPFRSFIIPLYFGKGIDSIRDTIMFSEMLGVLKKKGPYYSFEDETIGQGMAKTVEVLTNNPDTLAKIREVCYNWVSSENLPKVNLEETEVELEEDE